MEQSSGVEHPHIVVFSGGTAFNAIAGALSDFTTHVSHILPVSDDGGSTAEIVRVLGGPAVGDIRSRCLRLSSVATPEARAVKMLLAHRLPEDEKLAKEQWGEIVEGEHELWNEISEPYKHTIRAFLVNFQTQILRNSNQRFRFTHGSVGNFFFAGARTFFRSMEAALFMYARVSGIPPETLVLPVICCEERIGIGAQLKNGTKIFGQNNISHPPTFAGNLDVHKNVWEPLTSPIERIFYLSSGGGHEVTPTVHPSVIDHLKIAQIIIYGMGSLYTSICPSLILEGVGKVIGSRVGIPKVLLLNGSLDRETSGMKASDFLKAVTASLNRGSSSHGCLDFINFVLYPRGIDYLDLENLEGPEFSGIQVLDVDSIEDGSGGFLFVPETLVRVLSSLVFC